MTGHDPPASREDAFAGPPPTKLTFPLFSLSILENAETGGHFRINPTSGVLYTAGPLDAEMRTEHVLTVSAIDQGTAGTRKQSSAKVTVHVLDANDNDPIFFQQPSGSLDVQVILPASRPGVKCCVILALKVAKMEWKGGARK